MALKYKVAVVAVVILAIIVIGDGYRRTRKADQREATVKASVAGMSIQQLARLSAECDAAQSPGAPAAHAAEYCAEVWREIEDRPLQAVKVPRR
jgi:hypothetical protein